MSKLTAAMCWGCPELIPYKVHTYLSRKWDTAVLLCRISVTDGDFCYREKFFDNVFRELVAFKVCGVLNVSCYCEVKELFAGLKACSSKEELEEYLKC